MADTTYKFKLSGATFRFIASADKSTHSQWEAASGAISVECTVSEDGTTSYELNYHDSINTYPVRFLSNTDGYYYLAPTDTAEALNSYWEKFSYADYSNVLSLVKAETGNDVTVTVGKDAFLAYTSNTITITSEDGSDSENKYKLALPTGATEAEWSDITWTNAANTWSAAGTLSAGWFVKPDTADTISYASATAVQNSFALQSDTFVKNISADTLQQNVKFEGTCVTIGENVLGEGGAKVSSNRENLTVLLSDKLAPTETAAHWETVTETGQEEPTAGKFTYQSASNTAGHTLSGTTITYVPPVGEKSLFTLSNLGENVVLNPTEEELAAGKVAFKVSPDKRTYIGQTEYYGYIVELPKDIFDAAAAALTEDTGTITLSLGEALGELDSIQLYCAEDVPTYKDSIGEDGEVIANQNDATLEAVDGEENQFTYTSNSYSAYYDPITEQPEHKDKSITVHKAEAGKTFTIDGLASDAETANITFTDVAATGAEGQEGYDAAHYLFTVSKDALKEADIVIKNTATGDNLPEIRGAVSGDFASGAEEIDKDASVDGQVVTYTAAGYKAGYLTTKQLKADDSENPTYTKNIHTLSTDGTTAIAYVKQRHGESFTISGLNADTLAEVTENLSTDDKKKDTLIATKDGTITLAEGVTIKDNKLTLEKGALAEGLITFKPTNATEANYEANNYTAAEMAFGEGVNKIDTAPTVSVTGSTGETYIKAYQEAFKEAKDTLASTQENPYFKQDLSFKAATTETEDAGTETDTEAAKTASYDYTSSYSAAYYTKLPGYSDEAAARAASGGNYTNQLEGYMAGEGETAYMYTKEGDHIAKQSLTISGLKTGLESTALVEKREGDAEDVGQNATILVDYTVKDEDGKTVTPIVTINAAALPDADDRSGTSISIGGTDVSKFKLALDDKITTGANEQMSEEVAFKVEETQEDGKGTGTYVVTLKGNTAGYKEVTEENKSLFPDNKVGDFAYLDAKGAQQFTLTGLASGLLDGTDPNGFKAALKAISDSANGDKLPAISFEIKKDYLADADTYAEDGKGTIKITYDGTVDIKNETATATKADTDKTTVALTVTEDLSLVKAEAATWSSKPTEDETPTVNFIYTTELTADSWELGKTDGSTTENTLTYTAAVGGDNLITLSGLKDSDTATIATTTAALNEKATPQPADTTGEALVKKTGDSYYDTALHTGVTSWYKAADVDVAEDGTVTLKSGTTQEKDAIAIVDADGKLLKGELKNYLFNLPKDTFDKTKSTKVKYTKGTVTGEDAPFSGDTIFIGFDGIIPVLEANKPPKADASLTADTDADATGKTYKYVAEHTPAYVLQSAEDAGQPTTFTYTPAVGNYGFTISGLPTGLKDEGADKTALTTEAKINEYFTFTPPTQDAPNGTVTLTNKAFGVTEGTDYGTSDKTFTLSNLKLDGDGDGTDDSYKASATAEATPYTIAFALGANQSTETGVAEDATLTPTETGTDKTSATYTYTSEKTKAYFTLDDTTKTSLTYKASTGGEALFEISGLAYSKATVDGEETVTTPKLTTYTKDTAGYSTTTVADQGDIDVVVNTDAKTAAVKLYKGALAGEPVEITAKTKTVDGKDVPLATCTLSLFTKAEYEDGLKDLTGDAKTQYETKWEDKVVPTTADEAVGKIGNIKSGVQGATEPTGNYIFTAGGYYTQDATTGKVSFTGGADAIRINGLGDFLGGATITDGDITAKADDKGNTVYTITGKKTGANDEETTVDLLKITFTPATGEGQDAKAASYSVALCAGIDTSKAEDDAALTVALTVADHSANEGATIAFDTDSYPTSTEDAVAKLECKETKDEDGNVTSYEHIYTTKGTTAGFTASNNNATLTWTTGTTIDFTITGLKADVDTTKVAELIDYKKEAGNSAADPPTKDTYTFTFAESALNKENVTITSTELGDATTTDSETGDTTTNYYIVGAVTFAENSENKGTVAIDRGVAVGEDKVLTYTEAGWHKGYLTAEEVAVDENGEYNYGADANTNKDNAQIVYLKQRGGDTFTIQGIKDDVLTTITNALKDAATKDKVVTAKETTDSETGDTSTTVTVSNGKEDTDAKTYFTVNTTTGAVKLQADALGTTDIVFENTTKADDLASGYTDQKFTLNKEDIPQVDMGETNFTVPTTLKGTSYVTQYTEAYNKAHETAFSAVKDKIYNEIKVDGLKDSDQNLTGSYTYTSAYENTFFTALPTYSENAAKLAALDADESTDIQTLIDEGLMAPEGKTFFKRTEQTPKTTFTISGLSTTADSITKASFVEVTTGNGDTANAGIIVDYSKDLENRTNPTVKINLASVLDQTAGKVVALSDIKLNNTAATATLAFDDKLKTGEHEIMSEKVGFNVVENPDESGTYVVTLAGNTAGYVEVKADNLDELKKTYPTVKVGDFVNLAAKGAQQFTLTGLKSGIEETLKTDLASLSTGNTVDAISVAMKKDYLATEYADKATVKITYNGTVDIKGDKETATVGQGDETKVAFTATEKDLSLVEKSDGKWSQAVDAQENAVAGSFVFTTGDSGDKWTLGKSVDTNTTNDQLTYTASTGNQAIITLTGLASTATADTFVTPHTTEGENALTKLGFVPADASGKAYVRYTYKEYDEATDKLVPKVAYYDSSKVDVDEDGTVTLKSDTKEPGTEGTDAITLSTVTNYLVGLSKDAFDTSTMGAGEGQTPVVMTTTAVTNDDADYKGKTFGVLFGDEATTTATEGTQTDATLTETGDKTGIYNYVAAHKAHYFNDKAGTNTHTYTYCPAVGKYGFTISGLPTGKTIANINDLFEFKAPSTANKGVGSVTLTTAAFGAASFADYSTTDKASVISLTNIDLDGTDATTGTVDGTATNISIQLALPESDKGTGFYSEKTINKAGDVNAGTAAADGTYTYKYSTTSYFGYFDTDEAKTTVKYTAPVASEELFTISGLASGVYADTFNADGSLNKVYGINVDETSKVVTLYKDSLAGSNVTVTGDGVTLKLFDETAYNALTDADKAKYTTTGNNAKTPEDYYVPTTGVSNDASATAQDGTATFTAGYTEAFYTLNGTTGVTFTPQDGAPDQIKVTGLKSDITGDLSIATDQSNANKYTVSSNGTSLFIIEYHKGSTDDSATTYVDEGNPYYTVAIQPGALDTTNPNAAVAVTIEKEGITGNGAQAIFDTTAIASNLSQNVADDVLSEAAETTGTRTFTTKGKTAGYTLADDRTKLTWTDSDQKVFKFTGLSTGALSAQSDVVLAADQADGKYTFVIKPTTALDGKDVIITAEGINADNITATISTDLDKTVDGKTAINADITADETNNRVTYTAAGFQAGYLTAAQASSNTYGTVTVPENAKIVYAGQRGGETFTIDGLSGDVVSLITNRNKSETIPATDGTIVQGLKLSGTTLTVSGIALGTENIVFTNTTDKTKLEDPATAQTYTLELDTTAQVAAPTVSVASSVKPGTDYVTAYQDAFNDAVTETVKTDKNITKGASLMEHQDDAAAADANATSKVYDYVSSHTEAYFTALPTYDSKVYSMSNANGNTGGFEQDLQNQFMAADGYTVYKYKEAGDKTAFSIEGLATTTTDVEGNIDEIADANTATTKAIVVNTKDFTVTINDKSVLPTSPETNDIVKLSGDGVGSYTLAFGEALKTGANDVMSEEIKYSVVPNDSVKGTYTVTLAGKTAGYKEVDGTFVPQEQTGGQQFTITGLKSGLTSTEITKDLFVEDETTGNFTFKISNALLADKYDDKAEISITFNGTVTDVKSGTETEDKVTPNTDKTVAFNTDNLTNKEETSAAWKQEGDAFVYRTAMTADSWNPDNTNSASATAKLKYTASEGNDALISLSGLKSGVTVETLNKDFTPAYADANGKALVSETTYGLDDTTGKTTTIVKWYAADDTSKTAVVTETTVEGGATKTVVGKPAAYIVNLDDTVIDKTAMVTTGVTLTTTPKADVTDATYKNKDVFITFDGNTAQTGTPQQTAESLTQAKDADGTAVEGSYKYVAAHTPAYFSTETSETAANTQTIKYVQAVGQYGFTIKGLPKDTKTDSISDYFKFAQVENEDGTDTKDFTVTLTEKAFGTISEYTETKDSVISLTSIDLDGTETEAETGDANSIKLVLPDQNATNGFYTTKTESKAAGLDTKNAQFIEGSKGAYKYDYNAASYYGYFALADETTATTVKYTAAETGAKLFTISGLPSETNVYLVDDDTHVGAISVDEKDKVVTLRKDAFDKSNNVTIEGEDYKLAFFDEAAYKALPETLSESEKAKFKDKIVDANIAHVSGKFEADETNAGDYTFTAGYTPKQYTLDSAQTTATLTPQKGYADEIAINGLVKGINVADGAYTFTDDEKGSYVLKDKDGKTVLEIVHNDAVADDTTTEDSEAKAEGYTVKLHDGALPATPDEISLNITADTDRKGDNVEAAFNIDNISDDKKPQKTYGSFEVTAVDEGKDPVANNYTFTAKGTTAGYTIDENGNVVYAPDGRAQFTIEGIKAGITLAETTEANNAVKQLKDKGIDIAPVKDADGEETGEFTVTLSEEVLADMNIKLEGDKYTLALADGIPQNADAATEAGGFTVNNGTATYKITKINKWYEASNNAYTFNPERGGATFDIKGLATTVKDDDLNVKENAPIAIVESGVDSEDNITVNVTFNDTSIFGTGTIELDHEPGDGYEISMDVSANAKGTVKVADEQSDVAKEAAWNVADGKATYSAGGFDAYYQTTYDKDEDGKDTTDLKSLTYVKEDPNKDKFALGGLNTTLTAEALAGAIEFKDAEAEDEISTVTISEAIHGASGATITSNLGGYQIVVAAETNLTGTKDADIFEVTEAATVNGGGGNDIFSVNDEGAIVDGGAGNDTFNVTAGTVVFGEGADTVTFENSEDLTIKADEYAYTFDEDDVVLKNGDNTLTLVNAGGSTINFVDSEGNKSTVVFDAELFKGLQFNKEEKSTSVTVSETYTGKQVGPAEFAANNAFTTIEKIDASKYKNADGDGLAITGTALNNDIIGTDYGDTIDAGESTKESSNTIKGGTGDDLFIYRDGKLTITDFKSVEDDTDALQLMIGGTSSVQHEVKEVAISGNTLTFTLDEGSIELKDVFKSAATVDVAISDAQGDELSAYNYDKSGVITDGEESATLLSNFSKSEYTGANIDASAVTKALKLTLTDSGTVKGGKGADTFIIDEGASAVVIENYTADDKINFKALNKDVSGVSGRVSGDDVVLSCTGGESETVSVTVTGGAGKAINLVDNSGKVLASNVYSEIGIFNDKQTAITLAATATNFDANVYDGLASIDASAVTSAITVTANDTVKSYILGSDSAALVLNGGSKDDMLIAGSKGATLNGGGGTNTIVAGDGADVIVLNGGNDLVEGFNAKVDKLVTGGTSGAAELVSNELKANKSVYNLALEFDNGSKVTLAGVDSVTAVSIDNTAYTFGEGFVQIGTEVTLASNYDTKKAYAAADSITAVDATALTNGVSIIGGLSTTEIAGGAGNDYLGGVAKKLELTGGDGKDTFAYIGGAVSIADFAPSADAISLEEFTVTGLSAVTVTDEKVTLDFGQGNTLTFKDAENAEVNVFDAENTKGKKFNFATGEITSGKEQILLAGGTSVAIGDDYKYTLVTAAGDNITLDASATEKTKLALTLMNGGSAVGGDKDDTLTATAGGSLTGGLGADTFVFGGGNATITDYNAAQKDKIVSASDLTLSTVVSYSADKKDVILTYTDEGQVTNTLYIKDGADKALTLDGKSSTFSGQGTLNSAKTAISLAADTSEFIVNDTDYTKLSSIDASRVTVPGATITAGDVNTTITGGEVGLKLTGGTKNDVIISGDGADTIFVGAGGNDSLQNFDATKDALATVAGAKIDDAAIDTKKDTLTLTLTTPENDKGKTSTSKVVVENITVDDGAAKVSVNGAEWTFSEDIIKKGDAVQLTSKYTEKAYEADETISAVDATATKGLTLSGGNPYAVTLTGSEKGADTFVYDGGNDVITNYGKGKDVISLSSDAYDMSDLSGVKVTATNPDDAKDKSGTIALSFKKGDKTAETLSLNVEDTTKPVTIANNDTPKGTAYTFKDNAIAIGTKAITLLSGSDTLNVAEAADGSLKGYTSIALNYTATVTAAPKGSNVTLLKGGEITGDKGKDTLKAAGEGTAVLEGKGGADTFIYDGGDVTVTDYMQSDKDVVSIAADWNVSGITVGTEATTLSLSKGDDTGSLILTGVDSDTEVLFASGGGKATKSYFSNGKILDGQDDRKIKSAIAVGTADFSTLYDNATGAKDTIASLPEDDSKAARSKLEDYYKALVTITSGGNNADVTGNSKNNIITLANGGTAKGGIGNDTYIIGDEAVISDFGINAKTVMNTEGNGLIKLPTKVNTAADSKKDSIPAYSADVYAPGKDKVQVDGKIVGVTFSDDIAVPESKKDTTVSAANSFSVTLTVDTDTTTETEGDTFTVVLQNIQREAKYDKKTDSYLNKNSDYKDISSLQIYELDGTKYKQVKVDALITLANNADAPDFGSADLDDIMDVTPAVTTGDSGKTKDADSFIITGSGDDSSDLTSKKN